MNPLFTIIIPHYNIPDLLMRCLKSIPISEDIQVIVVDDNSPDADTYIEKYPDLSRPYLEFIPTKKGGGAGYARNVGLDHAKGKWLLFADADDFFVEDMYDMILSYIDSEADIIFFKMKSVLSDNVDTEYARDSHVNWSIDQYFSDGDEWYIRVKLYVPWGKMIKRNLICKYNIRFDEVMYGNDMFFSVQSGYYAESIKVVNRVLYVCTYRSNSLTDNMCSKPGELEIRAEEVFRVDRFLIQNKFDRGERSLNPYLWRMLKLDRRLFKYYYYFKLDELYPSKLKAINDLRKGKSLIKQVMLYIYVFLLWMMHYEYWKRRAHLTTSGKI